MKSLKEQIVEFLKTCKSETLADELIEKFIEPAYKEGWFDSIDALQKRFDNWKKELDHL